MKSKLLFLAICLVFIIGCKEEGIFDLKGNKISELEFKLKRETGILVVYYPNGNKKASSTYIDGDRIKEIEWYESGKEKRKREYTKSYSDWKEITWYENGKKEKETEIKNGVEHGKTTRWYENGKKQSEGEYYQGDFHGKWIWWYEKGQMKTLIEFKYGELDGKYINWDENGKITRDTIFKDGKIISDKYPSEAKNK